ncbi:MAG: rRNA maturation RNase YbeY [Gammaproteobacteria bacterium CG_4_10_14_0_8_um_filter_38_16]|nr:MAG: rRNA maturation RNase YbeY [Gammaproteobacteria bacterium CG_4_10_14_0_8_um_filter_38_16]PJA03439.1 MAG: rRNA maturation RNase YbeY [Gammaproteobacteria bacterium CG_4_10_14_0_2_um_filter_38_22]PJB10594.1 MAG: rRNA maturation RNase YbeY [Gammaproteobacteria bacterium CG_4_9_14_3_um_filter_38_9]
MLEREKKMIKVILLNEIKSKSSPQQKQFQIWVNQIIETIPNKIPKNANEICIAIISRDTSTQLNETYRHKKGPTNVLSFNYDAITSESLGDLAICAELVEAEAVDQQKSIEAHWAHLTVHGVLHLLGYDHIADDDAFTMETLETQIIKKIGFDNPYV